VHIGIGERYFAARIRHRLNIDRSGNCSRGDHFVIDQHHDVDLTDVHDVVDFGADNIDHTAIAGHRDSGDRSLSARS
jgi:hypothetical protein